MHKKVIIVGGLHVDEEESASLGIFRKYLSETLGDHEVDSVYIDQLSFIIANSGVDIYDNVSGKSLKEYDVVYIRGPKMRLRSTHAYYVSRFCELNGIHCVNDYSMYYPGTKIAQAMLFYEEKAPILKTIYSIDRSSILDRAESDLGYPMILKSSGGSHGDSNYLVNNREEALAVFEDEPDVDFIAQEFCKNDRDYRVLITKNDTLIFARRGREDTHLNNTSKGGAAELASANEVPREIIDLSLRITQRLKLMVAGIDVMPRYDTNDFYFLEVNSQPQLSTGAFLDEKRELMRNLFKDLN